MRLGVAAVLFRLRAVARRDSAQQRPVLVGEGWSVVLSVQDCDLVAQHDDLEVLRASQAHSQPCQQREEPVQNATHEAPGWSAKPLVSAHDRIVGTHRLV